MTDRYEKEFIEIHDFFRAWFRGEVDKTEAVFSRMAEACAEGFTFVTAMGRVLGREAILDSFYDRHGKYPAYNFWIENATIRHQLGDVTICTFSLEEGEERTGLHLTTTTAVYREWGSAPNGVVFLFVQDTPVTTWP